MTSKAPVINSTDKSPSLEKDSPSTNTTGETDIAHGTTTHVFTHDEYHLATLGYKQEFYRSLGFFESWAATFTSMNFVSGIPVLFG